MYAINSNTLDFQLLRVLSDGKIHTYKTLSSKLNCTSLSVFQSIQVALNYGIEISLINGFGVFWNRPFVWINEGAINTFLKDQKIFFNLTKFNLLDSTNSYLIRNKSVYLKHGTIPVIVSELQTKGRGTSNRNWFSNLGGCLTFSILWQYKHKIQHLPSLGLVVGVSLIRVFRNLALTSVHLKWPNDLLYKNKKFGGILIECNTNEQVSTAVIIGIGVNFKLSSNLASLVDYAVTDLYEITGYILDRNQILALFLIELRHVLNTFENYGFRVFRNEWQSYHIYQGQNIVLRLPNRLNVEGIVDGVQDDGSLTLITSSGRKNFNVGEISLRAKS